MLNIVNWRFNLMKYLIIKVFVFLVFFTGLHPCIATTIIPLDFSKVVEQSIVVVDGTVVDLQVISKGLDKQKSQPKDHVAPKKSSVETQEPTETEELKETEAQDETSFPIQQIVDVEGGEMLFTDITFAIEQEIFGEVSDIVTIRIPGGSDDKKSVTVFGMPEFELGKRYVLFLRPDYETTNVPIVGVNQGCFEVIWDAVMEEEILINANGDIVIGIESGRVDVRHNSMRINGHAFRLGQAPVPEESSGVKSIISPEVKQYWESMETPMTLNDFIATVRNKKGGIQ